MVLRVPPLVRLAGLGLAVLCACTPTEPPKQPAKKHGVLVNPANAGRELPATADLPNWRWEVLDEEQSLRPDSSWSTRPFGTWFPVRVEGARTEYVRIESSDRGARILGLRGEKPQSETIEWRMQLESETAVGASKTLGPHRQYMVVAHHSPIASGAKLVAINPVSGSVIWEQQLRGLGPVEHSKYRNEIQLEIRDGKVVVYGRESEGRYIEVRSLTGGRLLAHERVRAIGPESIPEGDARRDDPPSKNCEVFDRLSTADYSYALTYCYISSGATLTRHHPGSDELIWSVDLRGLGPVAHSEYFSNYELDIHEGNPIVTGWESAGSFLEIRDAETGAELWSIVKRD